MRRPVCMKERWTGYSVNEFDSHGRRAGLAGHAYSLWCWQSWRVNLLAVKLGSLGSWSRTQILTISRSGKKARINKVLKKKIKFVPSKLYVP